MKKNNFDLSFDEIMKRQMKLRWFIVMHVNGKLKPFLRECETKKKGEQLVKELTKTYKSLKTQNPEKYDRSVVKFTVLNKKKNYDLYFKLSHYEFVFTIGWGVRKLLQYLKKKQVETPGAE